MVWPIAVSGEIAVSGGMHLVGESPNNYYFKREMQHEDQFHDIPFS